MSWDFSSEEVIVEKLESQQRTIFAFSKKIKELEEKLAAFESIQDKYLQQRGQLDQAKKLVRSLISSDSLEIGWGDDLAEARAFLDKLEGK